ncbi:MAG: hypothetical protein JSR33_04405 [Proteobacteria bacterium]|nr:hypothetical protein [Pseudomonadota bacterium]
MNFSLFPSVKNKSDLNTSPLQPLHSQEAVRSRSSETKLEGVEIFGKFYSFQGTDKPMLCTLRAEPMDRKEDTYFMLSYIEGDEKYIQAVRLTVEKQELGTVLLGLSAIKNNRLAEFFTNLDKQVQTMDVSLQVKSTTSNYLYYFQGKSQNIKQLFPLLEDLMKDRFCNYGKDYLLTPLFTQFVNLYDTVEKNFENQQKAKAVKTSTEPSSPIPSGASLSPAL